MSNNPLFSNKEEVFYNNHSDEVNTNYKRPEFILIDDRHEKKQYTQFSADESPKPISSVKINDPETEKSATLSLRFLCFLGVIFCSIFGLGMFLMSLVSTVLAGVTLFQNHELNQGMKTFWKTFLNTFIAGFGFTLGLISPTIGLGLVALFFSVKSELVDEDIFRKIIRRSFSQHL